MPKKKPDTSGLITADADARRSVVGLVKVELSALLAGLKRLRRAEKKRSAKAAKSVHAVRIRTRRLGSILSVADAVAPADVVERLRAEIKSVRRAAGLVRDSDVRLEMIDRLAKRDAGWSVVGEAVHKDRTRALERLGRLARRIDGDRLLRLARKLKGEGPGLGLREAVSAAIPPMVERLRECARADLDQIEAVHELRVKAKAVRYALEIFAGALDASKAGRAAASLAELQRRLGELNDADGLLRRVIALRKERGKKGAGHLERLITAQQRVVNRLHRAAVAAWRERATGGLMRLILSACATAHASHEPAPQPPAPPAAGAGRALEAGIVVTRGAGAMVTAAGGARAERAKLNGHSHAGGAAHPARLAAIDVGSNSIRLIVAEAHPDGTYRVLDDEKDTVRLARGLDASGRLDERAMEQAAATITRMKRIAEGFGVAQLRAVATAAVREAENGAALVGLVKRWANLDLEVIPAEQEAALAYRSVAGAFDLSLLTAAVVDIGGGSTEVVLAAGGVIEKVYLLPIGAVRLTERYGGAAHAAGDRFEEVRRGLRELFRDRIGKAPLKPQLIIATGGTSTTLGAVALQHGHAPGSPAPGAAVQGLEIKRATVGRIVRQLRGLSLEDRARVPGLAPERADIIVPGVAILHGLMKHLDVRRLRVHSGGIRDGLLLSMAGALYPREGGDALASARDPLRGVYRLARACRFDQRHSEHVARLAVRLFDQIAGALPEKPAWATEEARLLLEAGALLLDVGYLINYAQHNRHSYSLIRHSDLPGLTARQVELVALIARYHRGGEPKDKHEGFGHLGEADRALIRVLGGIVRVAVGLDRAHRQVVQDVRVAPMDGGLRVAVIAGQEPEIDLWAAQRKAEMLERVLGLRLHFVHKAPEGAAAQAGAEGRGGRGALPATLG